LTSTFLRSAIPTFLSAYPASLAVFRIIVPGFAKAYVDTVCIIVTRGEYFTGIMVALFYHL